LFLRYNLNIDKHAFSVAVPTIWNQLPVAVTSSEAVAAFHQKVKTYLFEIAYPPQMFGCWLVGGWVGG